MILDRLAALAADRGPLDDADVARRFGKARAVVDAARWVTYEVVDERAKGVSGTATAYPARVAMVRAERLVAEVGMDMLGSEALVEHCFADAGFRDAMVAGVAGGTYEVQLNLIAGLVLGLPRH